MKGTRSLPFLVPVGYVFFGLSVAFPFCLPYDGYGHQSFIGFLFYFSRNLTLLQVQLSMVLTFNLIHT
jgi:hypothetical protein